MIWRRTQVAKGPVCKTGTHRFESGRRLALFAAAAVFVGCGEPPPQLEEIQKALPRRVMDRPNDTPPWSTAKYVRWSTLKAEGERVLIIDVPGGAVDALLDGEDVSHRLNDDFRTMFLHPRARPSLTGHLGWPSVTVLDKQGCVRATGSPTTNEALLALLDQGMAAREAGEESSLPAWKWDVPVPAAGDGTWTQDDPQAAAVFVQPNRGAPAVIWEGKPYLYGNRADAELLKDRPAARNFLDEVLPENHSYLSAEGPVMACPLPIPEPPPAPVPPEAVDGEAKPAAGG